MNPTISRHTLLPVVINYAPFTNMQFHSITHVAIHSNTFNSKAEITNTSTTAIIFALNWNIELYQKGHTSINNH